MQVPGLLSRDTPPTHVKPPPWEPTEIRPLTKPRCPSWDPWRHPQDGPSSTQTGGGGQPCFRVDPNADNRFKTKFPTSGAQACERLHRPRLTPCGEGSARWRNPAPQPGGFRHACCHVLGDLEQGVLCPRASRPLSACQAQVTSLESVVGSVLSAVAGRAVPGSPWAQAPRLRGLSQLCPGAHPLAIWAVVNVFKCPQHRGKSPGADPCASRRPEGGAPRRAGSLTLLAHSPPVLCAFTFPRGTTLSEARRRVHGRTEVRVL